MERLSFAGRVEREEPAVVDDGQPVAELVGLLHVVGREEDRLAVDVELAEDLPQRDAALRVEAGGRLVEEQHRRAGASRPAPPSAAAPCRPRAARTGASPAR